MWKIRNFSNNLILREINLHVVRMLDKSCPLDYSKSVKLIGILDSKAQWKFQKFTVTQIFREINFGESRNPTIAVFAFFRALIFDNLVNFSLQKVQKFINVKIQSL